jgi:hypothetical protein
MMKNNIKDGIKPNGVFTLKVVNKAGEILEEYTDNNLVVDLGKTNVAKLLGGDVDGAKIAKIAVGTGSLAPDVADSALTDMFSKAIDGVTYPDTNSALFSWTLGTDDANGLTLTEFGLLNDNDVLCARKVRSGIDKTNAISLIGSWKIYII